MNLLLSMIMMLPIAASAKDQVLTVNGLVCSFCAQGIEKKFKKDPRVEAIRVDIKAKKIFIKLKPDQIITNEEYESILNDAGYTLIGVQ